MANKFEEVDVRSGDEILTLRVPEGTGDEDIKSFLQEQDQRLKFGPSPLDLRTDPGGQEPVVKTQQAGPLGIVPPETRAEVAKSLEEISGSIPVFGELPEGIRSFPTQTALPALGTLGGASLGALTGPAAPLAIPLLAGLGGFTGEVISQELGISPESRFGRFMAATSPAIGPAFGRFQKLGKRFFGFVVRRSPPARAALARIELGNAVKEAESFGAKILEKQKGLLARPAKALFRAAKISKAPITSDNLASTRSALTSLKQEVSDFKNFPEGEQILKVIGQIEGDLFPTPKVVQGVAADLTPLKPEVKEITTESLGRIRQLVGASINRLEKASGVKLGAAKQFFAGLSDDMDTLIKGGGKAGKATMLRVAAGKRAKLQFAVRDLEGLVVNSTSSLKGSGDSIVFNAKKMLDNLRNLTDSKSDLFDKNFADALKDELPEIVKWLNTVNKIKLVSSGGPGSIVYRGITAGAGATIGGVVLGKPGAVIGAFMGAQGPEMITSLLLTSGGRKFLMATARAGQGTINDLHWALMAQFLAQGVTPREKVKPTPTEPVFRQGP